MPGLLLFRRISETACYRAAYKPILNVFAQGRKCVNLGSKAYQCDSSSFLLSLIDVSVESQIVEASEAVPLLSLLLRLDMQMIREMLASDELPEAEVPAKGTHA